MVSGAVNFQFGHLGGPGLGPQRRDAVQFVNKIPSDIIWEKHILCWGHGIEQTTPVYCIWASTWDCSVCFGWSKPRIQGYERSQSPL